LNPPIYTYTGNNIQTYTYQTWTSSNWQNSILQTNTYDGNGHQTLSTVQSWNTTSNSWQNSSKSTYTNNANGQPLEITNQSWDNNTSTWNNSSKYIYTYSSSTTGIEETEFNNAITVFPNPFTDRITIDFTTIIDKQPKSIKLVSVTGKVITEVSTTKNPATQLELDNLSSGLYFILVECASDTYTFKVMKQ